MVNFKEYSNRLLKVQLKDSETGEPIFGTVAGIGGLQPASSSLEISPYSCMFIKFADETHARNDDYSNSEIISLLSEDIQSIEVLF